VVGILALGGFAALFAGRLVEAPRGPIAVPNPDAAEAIVSEVAGVRHIEASAAPEQLIVDTVPPGRQDARILFFQGQVAQPTPDGGAVTTEAGGILYVDPELRVHRIPAHAEGREIVSVASAPDNGLWAVSGEGELLRLDGQGQMVANTRQTTFVFSYVASDPQGTAYLVRSPTQPAFRPVFGSAPLLLRVDEEGELDASIGQGVVPADFMLTHLASAGRVAIADSVIYFAPFIRDEVVALSPSGDTLWVVERGLPQAVDEPRFEVIDQRPVVDYAPVNTGIALGPDDRLYVLSVPGFSTDSGRVDVFDRHTGDLLRSGTVPTPLPTLAADESGRVYLIDDFELLTGVPPRERALFSAFDLETLDGHRVTSETVAGKVVLINFWASWCEPCREEMPALDALRRGIRHDDFAFLTFNEDVRLAPAKRFLEQFGSDFPVAVGRGNLRAKYHYVGLPFTVLLDRQGRVVNRWIGYAGDEQLQSIRSIITAELNREGSMDHGDGAMEHGETHTHN
jgi:thiol-disulfide isomerase/thioredoxin